MHKIKLTPEQELMLKTELEKLWNNPAYRQFEIFDLIKLKFAGTPLEKLTVCNLWYFRKKFGLIHEYQGGTGGRGHTSDNGKGDLCKLCGKIHVVGWRGHTFDHGNGTPCVKCGKIHKVKIHGKGGAHGHTGDKGRGDPCKKCGAIHKFGGHYKIKIKSMPKKPVVHKHIDYDLSKYAFAFFWYWVEIERKTTIGDVCPKCGKVHDIYPSRNKPWTKDMMRQARMHQVFPQEDSKIEIIMQNELTKLGIPYTTHKPIYGQPDIFIEPNICVFVDGCRFHACLIHRPEQNGGAIRRKMDEEITKDCLEHGYIVLRLWEHDIVNNLDFCINQILQEVKKCQYQKIVS